MKVLLLYPEFPDTFWSFRHALPFLGRRSAYPPLGLLTVSAMLPTQWQRKLVDLNVEKLRDRDLAWADVAFLSAMLVQGPSLSRLIARCREAGLRTVVGGPITSADLHVCEGRTTSSAARRKGSSGTWFPTWKPARRAGGTKPRGGRTWPRVHPPICASPGCGGTARCLSSIPGGARFPASFATSSSSSGEHPASRRRSRSWRSWSSSIAWDGGDRCSSWTTTSSATRRPSSSRFP